MSYQMGLYIVFGLYGPLMYWLLVMNVQRGESLIAPLVVLFVSPILLTFLAVAVEGRTLSELFDPSKQSWAFMFGDSLALTAAAAIAALAWPRIPQRSWFAGWWWVDISALVGLAAGIRFHLADSTGYRAVGAGLLLDSPTKIAHDLVTYPVLFGALLCVGLPLLRYRSWHTWAFLLCILVWVGLGVADGQRGLNPFDLHPAWNTQEFRPV